MQNHHVLIALGALLFLGGAIPATIGTTDSGLFLVYGGLAVAGALLMALGQKIGQNARNKR